MKDLYRDENGEQRKGEDRDSWVDVENRLICDNTTES